MAFCLAAPLNACALAQCNTLRCPRSVHKSSPIHASRTAHILHAYVASKGFPVIDWQQRRRSRVLQEIVEVAEKRRMNVTREALHEAFDLIETLIPGFYPSIDSMKAADWITLAGDVNGVAEKVVLLKTHYPALDLSAVLAAHPKMLLLSSAELDKNAQQVKQLLVAAKDMEALLQALPVLMDPRTLISVLVTVNKWYELKRDPLEVLEADPDLLTRAQANDVPLEPVYMNEDGEWTCPLFNYAEKRTDWQTYIDRTRYTRN